MIIQKLEKLVLLPSGPATQLVIKFYQSIPGVDSRLVDLSEIRYYVKSNSVFGRYCKTLIKLRNYLSHNDTSTLEQNEIMQQLYNNFIDAIHITKISNPDYIILLNKVIKKTKKIQPNNLEYQIGYELLEGCITGCDEFCPGHLLEECKINWREQLKYRQILILDGRHEGKIAIFQSWNGSNGTVYLDNKKQPLSCKTTKIKILTQN